MNRTVALILTFLSVACASIAAADPAGWPTWVQVLIAALAAGFAAIGIPATAGPATRTRNRRIDP